MNEENVGKTMIGYNREKNTVRYWGEKLFKKKKSGVSVGQAKNIRSQLKHIYSFMGDDVVDSVRPIDVDDMISDLAECNPITNKPMAKKTLRDIRNTATALFELAIENEAALRNAARGREIPRNAPQRKRRALTNEEQKWVIHTPHRARLAALIMMLAGLRKGEIIALTWQDIDLNDLVIHITHTVYAIGNVYYIKDGDKSGIDGRNVDIPIELAIELEEAKSYATSIYVCPKLDGNLQTPSSWAAMWRSYQRTLNFENGSFVQKPKSVYNPHGVPMVIDKLTPHMFRHTYATLLWASGIDALTASKLMGHADVETTIVIYTHFDKTLKRKEIDKFDVFVSGMFNLAKDQRNPMTNSFPS